MFTSPTYGKLNIQDIPEKIRIFFEKHEHYDAPVKIIVGTDSQNFDQTKVVSVIAVICEGHGGIFFYEVTRKPIIKDVRTKLHEETNDSLQVAEQLVGIMESEKRYEEMYLNCPISIQTGGSPAWTWASPTPGVRNWSAGSSPAATAARSNRTALWQVLLRIGFLSEVSGNAREEFLLPQTITHIRTR